MSNLPAIRKTLMDPKSAGQLKLALPNHITPEKFQRVALTALNQNSYIANCNPQSVMNALVKCAQDGLLPDGREAALVPFKGTAQYMPMVYGVIKKMRNSGEVSTVNAYIVYEHDEFDYLIENGEQRFTHRPKLSGERGKPVMAYCVVKLKDGEHHVEVMTVDEIEKARNAGGNKKSSPWDTWWDEMAKKTVIHRAAKRVPTSSDIEKFMNGDMRVTMTGRNEDDNAAEDTNDIIDNLNSEILDAVHSEVEDEDDDTFPGDLPNQTEDNSYAEMAGAK